MPPLGGTSPVRSMETFTVPPPSAVPPQSPWPPTKTPLPLTGASAVPAAMSTRSAVMITVGSSCRFQSVNAPCMASTLKPCGRSKRPRRSARSTVRRSTFTWPERIAPSARSSTWPPVWTSRRVSVPSPSMVWSFRLATSWSPVTMVTPSTSLSRVSRRPLAPKINLPPWSRTPGCRVIMGMPVSVPRTSISVAGDCVAASKPAAVVTTFVARVVVAVLVASVMEERFVAPHERRRRHATANAGIHDLIHRLRQTRRGQLTCIAGGAPTAGLRRSGRAARRRGGPAVRSLSSSVVEAPIPPTGPGGLSLRSNDPRLVASASLALDERAPIEFLESDAQLLLGVHHDRAVPGDGLADGLPRDEQEAHGISLRRDCHHVAVVEGHQVAVADQARPFHVEVVLALDFVAVRVLLLAEDPLTAEDVGEDGVAPRRGVGERLAGGQADVEVLGLGDDVAARAGHAARRAGDDLDGRAAGVGHFRDLRAPHSPIARRHHLV